MKCHLSDLLESIFWVYDYSDLIHVSFITHIGLMEICLQVVFGILSCCDSWVMWVVFIIKCRSLLHTVPTVRDPFLQYNDFVISIFEWQTLKLKMMSTMKDYDKLDCSQFPFFEINWFCKAFVRILIWRIRERLVPLWISVWYTSSSGLKARHCCRASWFAPRSSDNVCGL